MSKRSGGLLELVARGKKDVFFHSNPIVSFIHSVYIRSTPFTKEIYVTNPRNIPEWGRWVDFDLDHRGDIVKHPYLRLELPSWLPPSVQAINQTGLVTYDLSGTTYGYCNNIGFQIIESIQLFQDQVLIQENYGEHLEWSLSHLYSYVETKVIGDLIGHREETPLAVGRSLRSGYLRIPIPLLGWQSRNDPGLPMVALKGERFRIRVHLRKLEDVIVSSDGQISPYPWDKPLRIQNTKGGRIDTTFTTLPITCMRTVGLSLETTQVYLPADVQMFLQAQTLRIPFQSVQFQQYTLEDNSMTAASFHPSIPYTIPLPMEYSGSIYRLLLGFRSEASTCAGQRSALHSPIRSIRMNIANMDRIKQWPIQVFRDVTKYWKYPGSTTKEVYSLTLGGFETGYPMGTINFSRAVDPTLFVTLNAIDYDTRNISRKTYALLYAESWNIYTISYGKGSILFDE